MKEIWEIIKDFKGDNVIQLIVLVFCILITITKYSRFFFASDVELVLMKQKASQKRDISTAVLLFVVLSVSNVILSFDITFILVEGIIMLLTLIILGISQLWYKFRKKDNRGIISNCELIVIMIFAPMLIGYISLDNNISVISIAVIGSLVETALIWLLYNGFTPQINNLMIWNEEKKLFLYKKIDDEYLLCGYDKIMRDSDKIVIVKLQEILDGTYYLMFDKNGMAEAESNQDVRVD